MKGSVGTPTQMARLTRKRVRIPMPADYAAYLRAFNKARRKSGVPPSKMPPALPEHIWRLSAL